MADASLEADLLAALGASMPEPETSGLTETDTSQHQHQPQPAPDTLPEAPPVPPAAAAPAPTLPSLPLPHVASPPTAPAQAPIPTAAPAATPLPAPAPAAPTTAPVPELSSKISSPPVPKLAQPLAPSRIDAAVLQSPHAAPVSTPQTANGLRSPKRARSPDGLDESTIKRQKTEQTGQKEENAIEAPNLDLAAMLNDALANFDQHEIPESLDITMPDAGMPQPAAPASTTPEPERAENKIMKASSNPFYVMRSMSLPVLGNIAVQILLRLSQQPRSETQSLLADADSEFRKAYDMLRDIFRATRKAFSDSPLLSPDELDITDSEDRETIRMSNLAATAASVFGAQDVPLEDVHETFFSIFIPEDGEYKASLTEPLVCLKTCLFLDAQNKPEPRPDSRLLDTLFPANFDESLRQRTGDLILSTDEEGLANQVKERRELLVKSTDDESVKRSLEEQSSIEKFTESLSTFLQSHLGVVVDYAEKYGVNIPLNEEETATIRDPNSAEQQEDDSLAALLQSATSHLQTEEGDTTQVKDILADALASVQPGVEDDNLDLKKLIEQSLSSHIPELKESPDQLASNGLPDFDSKNLASLISEKLKNDLDIPTHGLPNLPTPPAGSNNVHPQYLGQLNHTHSSPYQSYPQGSTPQAPLGAAGENLPPNQSMPTAALYEKARQAAVAKSSNTTRREGLHSTRRPWTPEEEKALMAGLDMVKGPHWSQILSLFGQHGTISDILKDRTQVQLKDKARNLKLFFLKTNSEMPYYLQSVTGELKTRAPSQAARKEAEEKARMNLEEEQARIQGIMTLAGGLQNNHHSAANSPLAPSPVKRTSPATHLVGAGGGATNPTHGIANTASLPPVPISPRVKTEPADHHSHAHHKVTAFPPIQPAPPASATQQAHKPHLPALQPQPGFQHQQPKQVPQQQQYQPQQPRQHEPQKTAQQQQQHRQPLPQQPHGQPLPGQPKLQQQHHHQQQPPPQAQSQPQAQPLSQPRPTSQQPPATHQPASQTSQQQQQPQPVSNNVANSAPPQAYPLPPIPPNHHSTPDHAQDTKLFETLQAAIAASSASEGAAGTSGSGNQVSVAAAEGSGG